MRETTRNHRYEYDKRTVRSIHQKKLQKITHIIMILLLLVLTTGFVTGFHKAGKSETSPKHEKYFTSIEIQEGDSLWSIAEDNMTEEYASVKDYIKEVKRMNHLSSDQLTKGCYIVIPHYTVD